jgi:hypothetical protein
MMRWLLVAFCILACPVSTQAQEVFSWWHRGLLEFDLTPGSWAEFSRTETSEGQQTKEKLRCEVLARTDEGDHWIKLRFLNEEESYVLLVAPLDSLRQKDLLQGLRRVFKLLPAGAVEEEDLERVRNNRLLSRHFKDLFEDPTVEREALPDTTIEQQKIPRERVRLREVREVKVKMGRSDMVYRNEAVAVAQISPAVPIFGLLRSKVNTALAPANPDRNSPPPLLTEEELVCVAFGRKSTPRGLPAQVQKLLHSR